MDQGEGASGVGEARCGGEAVTSQEFARRMKEIGGIPIEGQERTYYDPEGGHEKADSLLCEALRDLGYGEGVEIFETLEKWYT